MSYDVTLVQFNGTTGGIDTFFLTGFPVSTPFNYLLLSMWVCLPVSGISKSDVAVGGEFGNVEAGSDIVTVLLASTNLPFYNASFSGPAIGIRYNLLVSVDCTTQTVQVYVNDQPATLTSGGWTGAGPFFQTSGFYAVDLGSSFGAVFPAVADVWERATPSFVDLSIVSNRRKFINRDLTPVDLGTDGSNPFGSAPPVFLTVPSAGAANDFATNFGSGGALSIDGGVTLSLQTSGICTLPTPPPPDNPLISSIVGKRSAA